MKTNPPWATHVGRLTGAVFLNVDKVFDNLWVNGLLYKLTTLYIPSYFVETIASDLHRRTSQTFFRSAISASRSIRYGLRNISEEPVGNIVRSRSLPKLESLVGLCYFHRVGKFRFTRACIPACMHRLINNLN
jgi:hypothetical protein